MTMVWTSNRLMTPFPHWVLDNFLPETVAERARDEFFLGSLPWTKRHHLYSRHKWTRTEGLSDGVEQALQYLEGPQIRRFLEKFTGIGPLIVDQDRFGGGQHCIQPSGSLGIHADFTHHPVTRMRRALNLLLYLNDGEERGGELELWDQEMRCCVRKIAPVFNRAVLFETSTTSYHGHPDPLPWNRPRLSLAVYYYVLEMPGTISPMLPTTDYRPRPQDWYKRARRRARILIKGR